MIPNVSWMVSADWIILFFMSEHRWRFAATPSVVAANCGISQSHANRRCKKLGDAGLLERLEDRGYYRISDAGMRYMLGELDQEDLEEMNPEE